MTSRRRYRNPQVQNSTLALIALALEAIAVATLVYLAYNHGSAPFWTP